jgi:hypothetical protein
MKMKTRTLLLGLGLAGAALAALAMTETQVRTAVGKWQQGDHIVPNPWAAVVDFVVDQAPVAVDTFADLAALTGRTTGALAATRGHLSSGGTGSALWLYDGSSATTTNTYSVIASAQGGRWLRLGAQWFTVTQLWDPASLDTNQSISFLVTNFSTLPAPSVGDFVIASHPGFTNVNLLVSANVQPGGIYVTLFNNSGAAFDAVTNLVRVAYWKY